MLSAGAEIGLNYRLVAHHFLRGSLRQYAPCSHYHDRITQARDEIHVVLNHAKRISFFPIKSHDCIANSSKQCAVHARTDFIEKNQLWVSHHGSAQFEKFFLPSGKVPG